MAACITPYYKTNVMTGNTIPCPCGSCPECTKRRTSAWSFRLMQEGKQALSAFFITCTYDNEHMLSITPNGYMTLNKRDWVLFMKKLRNRHAKGSLKYYSVGEYGSTGMRPHYHAIIFNADINIMRECWHHGNLYEGTVTGASIGYVLKYISKPSQIPQHKNDDRLREFSLMSKGIGANYLSPAMHDYHHADLTERMYCSLEGGEKISMPRYYKDKLYGKPTLLDAQGQPYANPKRTLIAAAALSRAEAAQSKLMATDGDRYYHNKAQRDLAAFKKQAYNNNKKTRYDF